MPLRDILNKDVSELFGRKGTMTEAPTEALCHEARLEIRTTGAKLDFYSTQPRLRLFSLTARLAGNLSISRSLSEDKIPTTRLGVPVEANNERYEVGVIFCGEDTEKALELTQAVMLPQTGEARSIHFNFAEKKQQAIYTFTVPAGIEISEFKPVEEKKSAASGPPSVAQLAAVLRATLQDRRDTVSTIEDLSVPLRADTVKLVGMLRDKLGPRHNFLTPPLQWLAQHIKGKGRSFNPSTMAAIALLLDMDTGKVTAADLDKVALGKLNLSTSWEALSQVSRFIGEPLDLREWKPRFEEAGLPFPEKPDAAAHERMTVALALIEERMSKRDTKMVLSNLVRESPSPRVDEIMRAWKRFLKPTPPGPFDGFKDYCDFLASLGCRMDPNTLLALCLYAETEAGRISVKQFEDWLEARGGLVLSAYTMQVVATALDLELLALSPGQTRMTASTYASLFQLSPRGMLQGLEKTDQSATTWRFIHARMDIEGTLPVGWRASGEVLLRTGFLERVTTEELSLFMELGNTFYASFQSDLDRRLIWRIVTPQQTVDAASSFVEGFRVYHFQNRVLADLRPTPPGETVAELQHSPAIYKDHRGSLHYYHPHRGPSADDGALEPVAMHLSFPHVAGMPTMLTEMGAEKLLGRIEQKAATELDKLEVIDQGLRIVLAQKADDGPVLTSKGLQSLVRNLDSPRLLQRLRQVMDIRTLDGLKRLYLNPDNAIFEYRIYEPILKGLKYIEILDFVCLALVYELCISDQTVTQGVVKIFDRHWFRSTLRNQLLVILESPNPVVRQLGCRLLCTDASLEEEGDRPIVEYELTRHLASDDAGTVHEAACSLLRLAIERVLPLPHLWSINRIEAEQSEDTTGDLGRERLKPQFVNATAQIRSWQSRTIRMLSGDPSKADEGSGTAISKAKGGLRDLGWLIVGARDALREDQKRGKLRKNSVLLLSSEHGLVELIKKFMASWQDYAAQTHASLPEVIQEVLADKNLSRYMEFVKGNDTYSHLWWPLDSGTEEFIPFWQYRDISNPEPLWIMQDGRGGNPLVNPFFSSLMHKALEHGPDKVRLCRLSSVTEARRTHPTAFKLEVFNSSHHTFNSFLDEMRIPAQFFLTVREQDLLNALASLSLHIEAAEVDVRPATSEEETPGLEPYTYRRSAAASSNEEVSHDLLLLARAIMEQFGLAGNFLPKIIYILKEARTYSVYHLW
jgi:hypothetical protein